MNIDGLKDIIHADVPAWVHRPIVKVLEYAFIGCVILGWLYFHPTEEKARQVVIATKAKEVIGVPVVDTKITSGTVATYKGGKTLKKKLTLPQGVVDDDKQEVLVASKIPAGERAHTVTTVINTETGKSETYVRTDPLPWLAFESRGEIGAYYGIKNGQQAIRVQARQDFIQVKAFHLGVIGSADVTHGARPDYFVGVGIAYKF